MEAVDAINLPHQVVAPHDEMSKAHGHTYNLGVEARQGELNSKRQSSSEICNKLVSSGRDWVNVKSLSTRHPAFFTSFFNGTIKRLVPSILFARENCPGAAHEFLFLSAS